jgi:hypothetical protein
MIHHRVSHVGNFSIVATANLKRKKEKKKRKREEKEKRKRGVSRVLLHARDGANDK